jgi:hypothetical protein
MKKRLVKFDFGKLHVQCRICYKMVSKGVLDLSGVFVDFYCENDNPENNKK